MPGQAPPPVPQSGPIGPGGFVDPSTAPGFQPAKPPLYDDWLGEDPKKQAQSGPPPAANYSGPPPNAGFNLPDLPTVPTNTLPDPGNSVGTTSAGGEDIDFDDLTQRFEKLKKKKSNFL